MARIAPQDIAAPRPHVPLRGHVRHFLGLLGGQIVQFGAVLGHVIQLPWLALE